MTPQEIGKVLFYARKRLKRKLISLARIVGVAPATLSRLEEAGSATIMNVIAVAESLGYEVLVELKEPMTDDELIELARQAGWSCCGGETREKLLAYGRLVIKRKNKRGTQADRLSNVQQESVGLQDNGLQSRELPEPKTSDSPT